MHALHMELRRPHPTPLPEQRTRTENLVVRLSERERAMLDAVAAYEQLTASEAFRWLVRRAYEQQEAAGAKAPRRATRASRLDTRRR